MKYISATPLTMPCNYDNSCEIEAEEIILNGAPGVHIQVGEQWSHNKKEVLLSFESAQKLIDHLRGIFPEIK